MRKVLFVDRGGTLLELAAPGSKAQYLLAAEQVKLVPGVIPALLKIQSAGYEIVVVTNQAGLGGKSYPRDAYDKVDTFVTALFASQGVKFAASFACPHRPEEGCACRKPGIGLVRDFVNASPLDRERSAMVGDSDSDLEF